MSRDREQLAWCAGFFDGEGNVCATTNKRDGRIQIRSQIGQCDRRVLDRMASIIGFGNVTGPYWQKHDGLMGGYRRRGKFYLSFNRFEHIQALVACLWPWLSQVKRAQAKKAMRLYIKDRLKR